MRYKKRLLVLMVLVVGLGPESGRAGRQDSKADRKSQDGGCKCVFSARAKWDKIILPRSSRRTQREEKYIFKHRGYRAAQWKEDIYGDRKRKNIFTKENKGNEIVVSANPMDIGTQAIRIFICHAKAKTMLLTPSLTVGARIGRRGILDSCLCGKERLAVKEESK